MPLWMKDGKLIVDETGAPIVCDECPCDEEGVVCCPEGTVIATIPNILVNSTDPINGCETTLCPSVGGEYVLEKGEGVCYWVYEEVFDCFSLVINYTWNDFPGPTQGGTLTLLISDIFSGSSAGGEWFIPYEDAGEDCNTNPLTLPVVSTFQSPDPGGHYVCELAGGAAGDATIDLE